MDAAAHGALLYRNGDSLYHALAPGTAGQVLSSGGPAADPSWTAAAATTLDGLTDVNLPASSQGDILYRNATEWVRLIAGTSGQVLTTAGAAANPAWQTVAPADLSPAVILAPASSARNVIQPTVDATALVLKANAAQTVPLTQYQDSTGAVLSEVSAIGRVGLGIAAVSTIRLLVNVTVAANLGVVVRSHASQSGNLIETQDSAGSNTGFFRVLAGGIASGPGAGTTSERFGAASAAGGSASTAFGNTASASAADAIAIGRSATASGGTGGMALGTSAMSTAGSNGIAIGRSAVAGTSSVSLGGSATTSGATTSIAIGTNAAATANNSVVIGGTSALGSVVVVGQGASATQANSVAVGQGAAASAQNSFACGFQSIASASGATALGSQANAGHVSAFCLGRDATSTAANQLVVGSTNGPINEGYFGRGVVAVAPSTFSLNATGGSGSNIAGANLVLAGGKGTGSALGGDIVFQMTIPAASSSTLNSLQDKWRMDCSGCFRSLAAIDDG